MAGVVEQYFGLMVPHRELAACIAWLEDGLRSVTETPYHTILGRSFLHHTDSAASFIVEFYRSAIHPGPLGAMYFEMNGFAINPDCWFFNGFGYKKGGALWTLTFEFEWMPDWDYETEEFILTGMEPVQSAFEELYSVEEQPLAMKLAGEITEHLVVARFNELIGAAHEVAKNDCPSLKGFPILSTAHEWDCLYPSE